MAETYKILDLDIDYSKLITTTTQSKKVLAEMKAELNELKKAGKESTDEFTKLDAEIKAQSNVVRINTKLISDYVQAGEGQNLTIEQQRKLLSAVSVQWAQLTEEEQNNTEEGKALTATKTRLTEELKRLEAATGDNRRNVGNYTQSILEAAKNNNIFGGTFSGVLNQLQGMKGTLQGMKDAFEASKGGATGFAGSMNVVKVAIASTGIGLLIIAIGVLIAALSKMTPIVDKVEQGMAAVGAVIDEVLQRVQKFASGVADFLSGNFSEGFDKMAGSVDNLSESLVNAANAAIELKKAQQDLEDAQRAQDVLNAKSAQQIAELTLQSKNRTLSEKERIDLINQADQIEKENFERKKALVDEELRQAYEAAEQKTELSKQEIQQLVEGTLAQEVEYKKRGTLGDAELDKIKDAQIKKYEILQESTGIQEKLNNRRDELEQKAQDKIEAAAKAAEEVQKKKEEARKKAQDATIKALQEESELFDALSGKEIKSESELVQSYQRRADILQKQREFNQISETKYSAEVAKLFDEFSTASEARLKALADARIKDAEEELALLKLTHESKIKDGKLLTDQLIQQELERLRLVKDAAEEIERQRFEAGEITAKEFRAFQLQGDKEFLDAQQALYDEKAQQVRDAKAIDMANDLELMKLKGTSEYDLQREQLQRQYEAEIAQANKVGADIQRIKQKYSEANKKIDKAEKENQLKLTADTLGSIAELLGKNTAAGKAAAVAQAGINTYLGVSQILAAPPSGPEPANTIIKGVAIAGTIATGIANVAKIVAIKAERGGKFGTVGGNYHSGGGTKYFGDDGNVIEMERDENFYVLNRGASQAINSLSSLNEYYGGVGFANPVRSGYYADGGMVSRSLEVPDISPQIGAAVADAIKDLKIYTDVKDVIRETGNRANLIDGANI